jgi:hypothetical protein
VIVLAVEVVGPWIDVRVELHEWPDFETPAWRIDRVME